MDLGYAKCEGGVQFFVWAAEMMDACHNLVCHVKGIDAANTDE